MCASKNFKQMKSLAEPIFNKSGLVSVPQGSRIYSSDRDCEGCQRWLVTVTLL